MKHTLVWFALLLPGCPDPTPDPAVPPQVFDPHDQCIGFGVTFSAAAYGDAYYFGYAPGWAGAAGGDVKPVAVGGIEYVSVSGPPYVDQNTPSFVAAVNGPALAIDTSHTPISTAPVLGVSEGTADLCIYDHDSITLHGGTRMVARNVEAILALPSSAYFQPFERQLPGTTYPFQDWRMFIGKRRAITVGLLGADDWRLVDQNLTIDLALDDADFTAATREDWDTVSRDVDHATTMRIRATQRNGDVWLGTAGFVDHVDHISLFPDPYARLDALRLQNGWTEACFASTVGGEIVIAAPYVFTATPQVIVHPDPLPSNCVYLEPVDSGSGALSVIVGTAALEVPFTVLPTGS